MGTCHYGALVSLGEPDDQVFLLLFGTGMRNFSGEATATVGGEPVAMLGPVPQGEFIGLDQVNLGPLPRSLAGQGLADIRLIVDGQLANVVSVRIE